MNILDAIRGQLFPIGAMGGSFPGGPTSGVPMDPGMSVPGAQQPVPMIDPSAANSAQRNALISLGLGLMAARDDRQGFGHGAALAFQNSQGGYQDAMNNAFHNTLLKRQADYQQQERDRQAKTQERQDRQNAATTAQRVSAAMSSPQYAQNPGAYLAAVQGDPAFREMLQASGLSLPQPQQTNQNGAIAQQPVTPEQYQQFAQRIGQFGQLDAAPTAPRDLNLKAVMGPNGKPILVPETQAIGATPYEKPPEQQLSRFTRPVGEGKVQDFTLDTHTGAEHPLGAPYTASKGAFSDQAQALLASLAAKGVALPVGLRSKDQMTATLNGLIEKFPALQPDEIADRIAGGQIDFGAAKKETTTAAAQAGRVAIATNELNTFAPLVLEASAKVPRGSFVPINRLMQMGEASISDPNLRQLRIGINSMLNAYDQLAARGGTDMNKRAEAHSLLNSADSPEALAAAIQMFQKEADAAGQAAAMATKYRPPGAAPKASDADAALLKKWGG